MAHSAKVRVLCKNNVYSGYVFDADNNQWRKINPTKAQIREMDVTRSCDSWFWAPVEKTESGKFKMADNRTATYAFESEQELNEILA